LAFANQHVKPERRYGPQNQTWRPDENCVTKAEIKVDERAFGWVDWAVWKILVKKVCYRKKTFNY